MLTPFTDQDEIDYPGLERLIEWYLDKGANALFAIAQSSEMQFLRLAERAAPSHFVVKQAAGRVPVVVSGHISDDPFSQIEELMWLRTSGPKHPELAEEINTFLVVAAVSEVLGYPALAKMYHQRIGTFNSIRCRVIT